MRKERPHIVVIGDSMLDRYLVGTSTRQSPEADVPVLENYMTDTKLGGAANVALSCRNLGADVRLITLAGGDAEAQLLQDLLDSESITADILIDEDRPTTLKTRVMLEEEHLLRVDRESTQAYSGMGKLMERVAAAHEIKPLDIVVLQDYNKGLLHAQTISTISDWCQQNGVLTCADPKLEHIDSYSGVTLFKPNRLEAQSMLGMKRLELGDAAGAIEQIADRMACRYVVLTLGGDGVLVWHDGLSKHFDVLDKAVVDVCGAGDAVLGALALSLYFGAEPDQLGQSAIEAGAAACSSSGVTPISLPDVPTIQGLR